MQHENKTRKIQQEKYSTKKYNTKNTTRKITLTLDLTLSLIIVIQFYFSQWNATQWKQY